MFKPSKKRHLKAKITAIDKLIWDLEFNRFQRQTLREEIRQQRDKTIEVLAFNKKKEQDDKVKELVEKDTKALEVLEEQLKMLDNEISGRDRTMQPSFDAQIEQAHVIKETLKVYINNI